MIGDNRKIIFPAFVVISVIFLISVAAQPVSGDVMVASSITMHAIVVPPPIEIFNNTTQPRGVTITWHYNVTLEGGYMNFSGVSRIHLNWNQYPDDSYVDLINAIEILDKNNLSGTFTVFLNQSSRSGDTNLGSAESSAVSVYINHGLQTYSNMGTLLINGTLSPSFNLSPTYIPYYIGFNYTRPPDTANSVGQYENFTFDFLLPL